MSCLGHLRRALVIGSIKNRKFWTYVHLWSGAQGV